MPSDSSSKVSTSHLWQTAGVALKESEKCRLLSVGKKDRTNMCAPAITGVTVLARYSLQEILMGTYLGSDGRRTKQIKKKSLQENALQRISTEVFVYLLLQIVLLCTLFIYLFLVLTGVE